MRHGTVRYWRRIAAGTLIATAIVLLVFARAGVHTPARELAHNFGISLLFSVCIAPLLGVAMPYLGPRLSCGLPYPWNWAATIAAMAGLALAGTALAVAVMVAAGSVAPADFVSWVRGSLRISVAVTLTVGIFITGYETMRARVAQASAEAHLASLEARVQPHFLFNTLNSIAALVHEDPDGAERMTTRLASLMRSALDSAADPLQPLDDELRVVRDYLEIEQVRFGDRLSFTIERDAATAGAMVPRFAVQTLVENSVNHAATAARGGAAIRVRVSTAAPRLSVAVEDDGGGFDGRTLPQGHGLAMLRDRLALLFGDARLAIDSRPGRTVVEMVLPLTTSDDARRRRIEREPSRT
jgi:hypothetical protein